jgi:hypothetical protein
MIIFFIEGYGCKNANYKPISQKKISRFASADTKKAMAAAMAFSKTQLF